MMKKIASIFILGLVLFGCSAARWSYLVSDQQYIELSKHYTINVQTFSDARSSKAENEPMKTGKVWLHWVPLVFYSNIAHVNRPEGHGLDMPSMTEILPEDTALELQNSGLFKMVTINETKPTDYTLKGTIVKTETKKTATAYGLSFVGTIIEGLIWIPSGLATNEMTMRFELINKKGKTILSQEYTANGWRVFFVYKLFSESAPRHLSPLYTEINRQLLRDVRLAIQADGDQ